MHVARRAVSLKRNEIFCGVHLTPTERANQLINCLSFEVFRSKARNIELQYSEGQHQRERAYVPAEAGNLLSKSPRK